jgi:hypothetical protein
MAIYPNRPHTIERALRKWAFYTALGVAATAAAGCGLNSEATAGITPPAGGIDLEAQPVTPNGIFAFSVQGYVTGPVTVERAELVPYKDQPLPDVEAYAVTLPVPDKKKFDDGSYGEERQWPPIIEHSEAKVVTFGPPGDHDVKLKRSGEYTFWVEEKGEQIGSTRLATGIEITSRRGTKTFTSFLPGWSEICVHKDLLGAHPDCENVIPQFTAWVKENG